MGAEDEDGQALRFVEDDGGFAIRGFSGDFRNGGAEGRGVVLTAALGVCGGDGRNEDERDEEMFHGMMEPFNAEGVAG